MPRKVIAICLGAAAMVLLLCLGLLASIALKLPPGIWLWPPPAVASQSNRAAVESATVTSTNVLPAWQIQSTPIAPPQDSRSQPPATVTTCGGSAITQQGSLNGVDSAQIIVMPEATRQHIREIFLKGQSLGRNPRSFSKIGDSTMIWPVFLAVFDNPTGYKLGAFAYLQPSIEQHAGSFARNSTAAVKGMHTWTEFDATWADQQQCKAGEGPLPCELRLHNPSVAIIRLGTNDAYVPVQFEANLRQIVDYCISNGVVPILGTKPDRLDTDNSINQIVYKLAASYSIPLWDYDLIAATVPGKGLQEDKLHYLADGTHDYSSPMLSWGADSWEDLTGLMLLDAVDRVLQIGNVAR